MSTIELPARHRATDASPQGSRATEASPRTSRVAWWRMPFSADTWRRTLYLFLAVPVSAVCVPLALLGGPRAAARLQRGLAYRCLALRIDEPAGGGTAGRTIAHAVLSLPLALASAALTGYLWLISPMNLGYPLRPGTMESLHNAWGGPSLAGAWAVHATGGLVIMFMIPWIVRGATWLHAGLTRRLLGAGRSGR